MYSLLKLSEMTASWGKKTTLLYVINAILDNAGMGAYM